MALNNSIRLIGHCGTHPSIKDYGNGKKVLRLPVYTEHWSLPNEEGKRQEFKEIHWCVFFGLNAERASRLLMKGSQVHISGSMHYHKVTRNDRLETRPQVIVEEFTISNRAVDHRH